MSKKQQAQQLFNSLYRTHTRKEIIDTFCNQLNMSSAGATTYYYSCQKEMTNDKDVTQSLSNVHQSTPTILTKNQQIIERCHQVFKLAESLFKLDLSQVQIDFSVVGKCAGKASKRLGKYKVSFNQQAVFNYFDDMSNDVVPHEIAHIVCFMNPLLGRNHDKGWKKVCRMLGGDDSRTHSMNLSPAKKVKRYQYQFHNKHNQLIEEFYNVGPKHHKYLQQHPITGTLIFKNGNKIYSRSFIKMVVTQ